MNLLMLSYVGSDPSSDSRILCSSSDISVLSIKPYAINCARALSDKVEFLRSSSASSRC